MAAIFTTSMYGIPVNSTMKKAAAPITGGRNWLPMEAAVSMPAATCGVVAAPLHEWNREGAHGRGVGGRAAGHRPEQRTGGNRHLAAAAGAPTHQGCTAAR